MDKYLHYRKGDNLAVAVVLLLAVVVLLCFLPSKSVPAVAQVYQNGTMVKTLPLDEDQTISIAGKYTNNITVLDGKVAITKSDCPGEDCVHSGWTGSAGRSIVCLPNGVEVRIAGLSDDVDFVVR